MVLKYCIDPDEWNEHWVIKSSKLSPKHDLKAADELVARERVLPDLKPVFREALSTAYLFYHNKCW